MVLFVSGFFFNKEEFKMVDTDNISSLGKNV